MSENIVGKKSMMIRFDAFIVEILWVRLKEIQQITFLKI